MNNKILGNRGEGISEQYVRKKGYEILRRNFLCKFGEIDLIAKDGDEIVFIEVKTRKSLKYGEPKDSVNSVKKKNIYKSAEYYLLINNKLNEYVRFDVIEIYVQPDGETIINHIKNVIRDKDDINKRYY